MCGITGIIGEVDEHALRRMTGRLYHRGPDGGGIWLAKDGKAGLGHRRLKIIDMSDNGRQPMISNDGRYILTYNGEIFNFRELRTRLESQGHRFRSGTDSEVLLCAYMEWGSEVVHRLVGQFAFAVWDTVELSLFAARDHLGVKPFYYHHNGGNLYFASEAKAILEVFPESRQPDINRLPEYLSFLWVPGSATMFKGIRKLEPGSWLRFGGSRLETGIYWNVLDASQERSVLGKEERVSRFRELFQEAVRSQLASDVPLGLLLSGGVDSTAILDAMHRENRAVHAFTATYAPESRAEDVFDDDLPHARAAARHYGASLDESLLEQDVVTALPRVVWHLDEPLADPTTITNEALTRAAKSSLTVLLTGMGADEILAGYPRYPATLLGERMGWAPAFAFRATHTLLAAMLRVGAVSIGRSRRWLTMLEHTPRPFQERFLGFSSYFDEEGIGRVLHPDARSGLRLAERYAYHRACFDRAEGRSLLDRMLYVDLMTFLPNLNLENMDKTSMANSVEMRVPFLDYRLVEFCFTLPDEDKLDGFRSKILLRHAFADRIPGAILTRSKTGYSPPIRGWMRGPIHDYARELLLSDRCRQRGLWNHAEIERLFNENDRGVRDNGMKLWQLLVLETWFRVSIENDYQPGTPPNPSLLQRIH